MRGNPEEVEGLPIPPGAGSHPQYIELSRGTPGNAPGKPGVPKPPKPPKPPRPLKPPRSASV